MHLNNALSPSSLGVNFLLDVLDTVIVMVCNGELFDILKMYWIIFVLTDKKYIKISNICLYWNNTQTKLYLELSECLTQGEILEKTMAMLENAKAAWMWEIRIDKVTRGYETKNIMNGSLRAENKRKYPGSW